MVCSCFFANEMPVEAFLFSEWSSSLIAILFNDSMKAGFCSFKKSRFTSLFDAFHSVKHMLLWREMIVLVTRCKSERISVCYETSLNLPALGLKYDSSEPLLCSTTKPYVLVL